MIIEFKRNGRQKRINPKLGRLLAKQGHVSIVDVGVETVATEKLVVGTSSFTVVEPETEMEEFQFESMNIEQLREMAAAMGVPVHHRAGEEKIRSALAEAMQ